MIRKIRSKAWEEYKLIIDDTNRTQEEIFKKAYGDSNNFMTPYLIGYGLINAKKHIVYELSHGTDFEYNRIYGVTVTDGNERFYDDSQSFSSIDEALKHIQNLISKYDKE